MATRIIFKVEEITEAAMNLVESQRRQATEAELDELDKQLRQDGDDRTQDYLTLLRSLRDDFQQLSEMPGVLGRSRQLQERVNETLQATVDKLRETLSMATLIRKLDGAARRKIQLEREQLMNEIMSTVDQLRATVRDFEQLVRADDGADLNTLRGELEASLEIAKRAEKRMRDLDSTNSSYSEQQTKQPDS